MKAIEFKNVSKIYRRHFWEPSFQALHGVSFQVEEGSIYGFLGANGAGKTTSIKLMLGLQKTSSGEILFWGRPASEEKHRIGYLPERPFFHDNLTAHEFLDFHRSLFGNRLRRNTPSNEELLEIVDLPGTGRKLLKEFSKGMLQRVGAAQALVNDPDLLLWDEPMSGLDPVGRRHMRNLMVRLAEKGKTIFFSSHILSDVEAICHRVAFLEKGVLRREAPVQELLTGSAGGQEIIFTLPAGKTPDFPDATRTGETFTVVTPGPEASRKVMERVWILGGAVKSVLPEHATLEDALFGRAKGGRP
ncbi:MAG: ABC transporter ATP-binding protein [Bdellovibrionales bacterium]|nr:ABC transporter ATP-binding protein [Bdellovibrionales bacterium]